MMMTTSQLMPFLLLILLTWTVYGDVPTTSEMVEQMRADLDSLIASQSQQVEEEDQLRQNICRVLTKPNAETRQSAFLATFSVGNMMTPRSEPFKFDNVIFNDGNDYNTTLGVYEAPLDGVYSLGVQLHLNTPTNDDGWPTFDLKVNGIVMNRMSLSVPRTKSERGGGTVTSSLPFKLKAGDKVWVEGTANRVHAIVGQSHSFFSGVLLYPE